jgi:hypothetical protein
MMGCAMAKLVSGATGVGPGVIRYIFIRSSLTLTNLAACEGIFPKKPFLVSQAFQPVRWRRLSSLYGGAGFLACAPLLQLLQLLPPGRWDFTNQPRRREDILLQATSKPKIHQSVILNGAQRSEESLLLMR